MKRILLIPIFLFGMAGSAYALDEPAPGPEPAWVTDAGPVDAPAVAPVKAAEPEAEPTLSSVIEELGNAKLAIDELRAAKPGTRTAAWMAALLAITIVLLSLLKIVIKKVPERWEKWKPWMSRIAGLLGVLVGFFEAYTGSMVVAVAYGLMPPLAVWVNELYSTTKAKQ